MHGADWAQGDFEACLGCMANQLHCCSRDRSHVANPRGLTSFKWPLRHIPQPSEEIFLPCFWSGVKHHRPAFEKARRNPCQGQGQGQAQPLPTLQKNQWIWASKGPCWGERGRQPSPLLPDPWHAHGQTTNPPISQLKQVRNNGEMEGAGKSGLPT